MQQALSSILVLDLSSSSAAEGGHAIGHWATRHRRDFRRAAAAVRSPLGPLAGFLIAGTLVLPMWAAAWALWSVLS